MTVTPIGLTKTSAVAATAAGVIFIGVQIGHPQLNTTSIATTNVYIRDQFKVLMCVLGLIGITGMYLSQVRRNGVLGLIGYGVLSVFYLLTMTDVYVAAYVAPEIATSSQRFVSDLIASDTSRGTIVGDLGALQTITQLRGVAFLAGGLLFGIALWRAGILARWACALLAAGGFVSVILSLMPDAFYRVLAFPHAIAMIGLGISLWRTTSTTSAATPAGEPMATMPAPRAHPAIEDTAAEDTAATETPMTPPAGSTRP